MGKSSGKPKKNRSGKGKGKGKGKSSKHRSSKRKTLKGAKRVVMYLKG